MRNVVVPYVDLVEQHRELRAELRAAIETVLDHGQFIGGPEVQALEKRLADRLGATEVVGVNSGTDALALALRLRSIGPGDEVLTVSHSFVATASAIALVGATPVFVDIDESTMLLDPQCVESAITPRTRAVAPVHLNGYPCDMDSLLEICERHGLALVEDCAQSLGACYHGRMTGTFGIGAFSLHPLKVLSACGDAGFIAVQNVHDAERLRALRNIGLATRERCDYLGPNSRLDTIQAAILLVKLRRLDEWIRARREHAAAYRQALTGKVVLPPESDQSDPIWSSFVIRHPHRDRLLEAIRSRGIDARVHYPVAIHQQPAFAYLAPRPLPVTEKVVSQIISLPVSAELSSTDRDRVIVAVLESLKELEA